MTHEEFENTAFRNGDQVKYKNKIYDILIVDFELYYFAVYCGELKNCWLKCINVDYIPKK